MPSPRLEPIAAPLYDPRYEHDACGVGFVADPHRRHPAGPVALALEALAALAHRGARAADDATGDGAGISIPISGRGPGGGVCGWSASLAGYENGRTISEEKVRTMQTVWGLLDHDLPHAGELSLLLGADGMPGVEI